MSWDKAYNVVIGETPPDDSLELRNSFIEGVLSNRSGEGVTQHDLHKHIQRAIFEWEMKGVREGIISAPYGSGKSQQVPIALAAYHSTRDPNTRHIIISADPDLAKSRITSLRFLFESKNYKYWCKDHNFKPVEFSKRDTDGSQTIHLKNATGQQSYFAAGIETKGTGWRCDYLWGDDICNNEDFQSPATREKRFKAWTNTWTKRIEGNGYEYLIRTPYHPSDANEKLLKSGIYAHLEISVREDMEGYDVKETIPGDGLVLDTRIPIWEINHSKEKLEKEQAKDYAAYQLGFRMLKEVQDPSKSAYKHFSEQEYPAGNVYNVEFDWANKNPLEMTCDFNRSPHCWAFCQRQELMGQEVYAFIDELVSDDALTEEQAIEAAQRILAMGHTHVELYGDGTGNQGGARYGRSGENDWTTVTRILKEHGISYRKRVKKSNPLRAERVKVVNNTIKSVKGGQDVRKMVVNPRCKNIIDDYKFSIVDNNGEKKKDQGERGHISDACDYRIYAGEKSGSYAYLIK